MRRFLTATHWSPDSTGWVRRSSRNTARRQCFGPVINSRSARCTRYGFIVPINRKFAMDPTIHLNPKHGAVDPITLEVIRHGLVSITDQIDANITRTAFSPYIYEYKDFAVGLVSADGELIAQCTGGMPVFVADSVGMAVRDGLATYGAARLHHGDVVVCNHAAIQGQHLNNTVMYTPIYAGPQRSVLIGFFAINVHWIDIGGITPPAIFSWKACSCARSNFGPGENRFKKSTGSSKTTRGFQWSCSAISPRNKQAAFSAV